MLIDSHCHLDVDAFDADRAEVVARAKAQGVAVQIVPAICRRAWPRLREVCGEDDALCPAYGLHPVFLARHAPDDLDALAQWIERERPVAVGECGLDHYVDGLDRDLQLHYFERQLALARDARLPVIVHARRAVEAVIAAIRRVAAAGPEGALRGVVHSYAGSEEQARQLWRLGFLIGLGGPVTYPRAQRLRRLVAGMPLEHLLLETDAPDQPDAGIRGQRNEPARLLAVCAAVAQLRGETVAAVARATSENARRLFALPEAGVPGNHPHRSPPLE